MKSRKRIYVAPLTLLVAVHAAVGSNTWCVDGVNGSNHNDCKSSQTACKTIGHAMALTSKGDSIIVAAATYHENLTMPHSLNIVGSGRNDNY